MIDNRQRGAKTRVTYITESLFDLKSTETERRPAEAAATVTRGTKEGEGEDLDRTAEHYWEGCGTRAMVAKVASTAGWEVVEVEECPATLAED